MAQSIGMIGLQTPEGLVFGQTLQIQPRGLMFEADAKLVPGERVTWRMELTGWEGSVCGELEVIERSKAPGATVERFKARIWSLQEGDEQLFERWLDDRARGGTSLRLEQTSSTISSVRATGGMVGSSPEERDNALGRINARRDRARRHRQQVMDGSKTPLSQPSDLGLATETMTDVGEARRGRAALRGALRAGVKRARSSPVSGTHSQLSDADERSLRRARLRAAMRERTGDPEHSGGARASSLRGGSRLPPPGGPDRTAGVAPAARGGGREVSLRDGPRPVIVVVYPTALELAEDWHSSLKSSGLVVPRLASWQLYEDLRVEMKLPGGRVESLSARVVSDLGPAGVALQVELDARQRARIRQLAEEAG